MTHRPDRERIIKECEWAIARIEDYGSTTMMSRSFFADVEKLLKEQEAVEPVKKEMVEVTARYEFDCPCGAPLLIGQPYCADCGKPVKWE